jgi:hypothetical protein
MAISLASDVIKYFNTRGSTVYACTLDAEMAFDGIPHSVLLYKAINVIPDPWWCILYMWYKYLKVRIKWNGNLSDCFRIERGTRQGGLTSPFLFNIFYQDLVSDLHMTTGGLKIDNISYSVLAYADDLLLLSATVSGLQGLINYANEYIKSHGLNFNNSKTKCITFGKQYFTCPPNWFMNNSRLCSEDSIEYLGTVLSNNSVSHKDKRIKSCRHGYYKIQCAGMYRNGASPNIVAYLWRAALQPVLLYGSECLVLRNNDVNEMEKFQARIIKCSLGLSKFCRNTPLLKALHIKCVRGIIQSNTVNLLKSVLSGSSLAMSFYSHMLIYQEQDKSHSLVSRSLLYLRQHNMSLVKYLLDDVYASYASKRFNYITYNNHGLVDSLKGLFKQYTDHDRDMTNLLLRPF